ncbi:hypothetical protein [Mucilaginibacter flavus]|nr:hypothetical protein [Mucilaginibacter flavus]MDN3582055.1 hypothetical protein [Mucilaginibacter flavus]
MKKLKLVILFLFWGTALFAQEKPLTIENYYKIKWGTQMSL